MEQQLNEREQKYAEQEGIAQRIKGIYFESEQGRQDVRDLGCPFKLDFDDHPFYSIQVARANARSFMLTLEEKGYQFPKEEK